MPSAAPPRKPPNAAPLPESLDAQELLASARRALGSLLDTGDPRAAEALAALARPPGSPPRPMERLLARLGSARPAPSEPEWAEAFEEARGRDDAPAWEADCLRAVLNVPEEWEGLEFLRFLDEQDELGAGEESLDLLLAFVERAATIGSGLGHPAHELIHRLLAGSDLGPACGIALDAERERRLVELVFRPPRCSTPEQKRSALLAMWESLWAAAENATISRLALPRATASLFASHEALSTPLSGFPAPGFGDPAAALFSERSEPDPEDFPACLALLSGEGWSMAPESFVRLACALGDAGVDASRRARNLAHVARAAPNLGRAEILGLPVAYHLNTARAAIRPAPENFGAEAIDWLFAELCALGMNPLDVWPARDPALVSGSARIRSEVERALFSATASGGAGSPPKGRKEKGEARRSL